MSQLKTTGRKEFPLIVKADVQGSLEAIVGSLEKLGTDEVAARVIHSGVGGITESDVTLSHSSGAAIIGFNVRAHKEARELSERDDVEIRYYNIIYDLVDDVKKAMSGLLTPERRETMLGNATILEEQHQLNQEQAKPRIDRSSTVAGRQRRRSASKAHIAFFTSSTR